MRSDEKSGSPEEAISRTPPGTLKQALAEVEQKSLHLLRETALLTQSGLNGKQLSILAGITRQDTTAILSLPADSALDPDLSRELFPSALQLDKNVPTRESAAAWGSLLCWAFTRRLGAVLGEEHAVERSRSWIDEWLLGKIIAGSLQEMGMEESSAWRAVNLIRILVQHQDWANPVNETPGGGSQAALVLQSWLQDGEVQRYLGINRYGQILWFNQESFEDLLGWMYAIAAIQIKARATSTPQDSERHIQELTGVIRRLHQAIDASGYQVEKLLQKAGESS